MLLFCRNIICFYLFFNAELSCLFFKSGIFFLVLIPRVHCDRARKDDEGQAACRMGSGFRFLLWRAFIWMATATNRLRAFHTSWWWWWWLFEDPKWIRKKKRFSKQIPSPLGHSVNQPHCHSSWKGTLLGALGMGHRVPGGAPGISYYRVPYRDRERGVK